MSANELGTLYRDLQNAKAELAHAEARVSMIQDEIVKTARIKGVKSMSGESDGQRFTMTVVTTERLVYNDKSLKKALGAKLWKTVTTQRIDSSKLKHAISSGLIDAVIVAQNSEIKESAPYVRVSEHTAGSTQQRDSSGN